MLKTLTFKLLLKICPMRLMMKFVILVIIVASFMDSLSANSQVPLAASSPDTLRIGNHVLIDNWSWLRQRDNLEVLRQLKAENKYAKKVMKHSRNLAKQLYREFKRTADYTETSYPYKEKGYLYFTKDIKGKSYPIHYRKKDSPDAKEEVILDENKLAHGKDFLALGIYTISPDQRMLAYSIDTIGDEIYTLYFKDLMTGKTTRSDISNVTDFRWFNDSCSFIYITANDRMQSDCCYAGSLSNAVPTEKYKEKDNCFDLSLYSSIDKSIIFMSCSSKDETELWYLSADTPQSELKCFQHRISKLIYYPDHYQKTFYILTNLHCIDYSIEACADSITDVSKWQPVISGNEGEPISSFLIFDSKLVVLKRIQGFDACVIYDRQNGMKLDAIIPESVSDLTFWHNPDPYAEYFTYTLENDLLPLTIMSYSLSERTTKQLYQYPVHTKIKLSDYQIKLVWVSSFDGTKVPLRLVYHKSIDLSTPHPLWLYGYGSYGDTEDPYFSETRFSLLKHNIIYAVANIRGGGEFGQSWYDSGRLMNKKNTFADFIACMDYLIDQNVTTPAQMVIEGGSAGGLLMGAVANQAYTKCSLVIADVPFVDVVNTMLDDTLPLTSQEFEEWGNPHQEDVLDYMLSYSPYDNVCSVPYPKFLISAAWNDTRVGYWEALKWTQKLRSKTTSSNPVIFRIYWHEGHTGTNNRFQSLRTYSETMAYAMLTIKPDIYNHFKE